MERLTPRSSSLVISHDITPFLDIYSIQCHREWNWPLMPKLDCSWLECGNTTHVHMLILYSPMLLHSFMSTQLSQGFSTYRIMSSVSRESCFFRPHLNALAELSMALESSGGRS